METVGRLGGVSVADVVGQDEEIFVAVEGLTRAEENVGEEWIEQAAAIAAGTVQQEDSVVDLAACSAMRLAQGEVMQVELRQSPRRCRSGSSGSYRGGRLRATWRFAASVRRP